jgi:hypothetical protein
VKPIDSRIADADPLRLDLSAIPDEAAQAMLQEITMQTRLDEIVTTPPQRKPLRRRRIGLLALAVAGALALPGAAYAVYQDMHSGKIGTGGEEVVSEEFLYADSPEIVGVVQELTAEFPLPPGYDFDSVIARYPAKERILMQRTGIGSEVGLNAACMWYRHWLDADRAGRATDQKTIDAIPDWPYLKGSGTDEVLTRIAKETRSGNPATARQFVTANC